MAGVEVRLNTLLRLAAGVCGFPGAMRKCELQREKLEDYIEKAVEELARKAGEK